MSETSQFLTHYGLPIIFGAVFLDQMGLPFPAVPWLLAAGALSVTGKFHWIMGLEASVLACLVADFIWFYLGRYRGTHVLRFLCLISLEPDSCVRRTVDVFSRYGWRGIVGAKFVPGISTIAPPMAGMSGVSAGQFLLLDGAGSLLYCGAFLLLGAIFSNQITQIGAALAHVGGSALEALAVLLALYIAWKYWQRQRLLHELKTAKITVDELGKMLDAGESPFILDMRAASELELDPAIIRGAVHVEGKDLEHRVKEFPMDREIVVYCDCPNEVSSAKAALQLRRRGFSRVRPLLGGITAWRKGNYPMGVWTKTTMTRTTTVLVGQEPGATGEKDKPASKHKHNSVHNS